MTNTEYVAGFYFSNDLTSVLLVRKAKPAWQKGKLNGIGGKVGGIRNMATGEIISEESPESTMVREFLEETGIKTKQSDWLRFCVLNCKPSRIHFYAIKSSYSVSDLAKFEGVAKDADPTNPEYIEHYYLAKLGGPVIPNLNWLIPMALNKLNNVDGSFDVLEC